MKRGLLVLAALTLTAVSCASDPEPATPTNPVTLAGTVSAHGQKTLAGAKPTIEIVAADDYFEPTFLKADKQATVSLTLRNTGMHSHTFTIAALGVDQMLEPGATKTLAFTLPSALGAAFFCKFHAGTGMQGAFYYAEGTSFVSGSPSPTPTQEASEEPGYNY